MLGRFALASAAGKKNRKDRMEKKQPHLLECSLRAKCPLTSAYFNVYMKYMHKGRMSWPLPCCSCCSFVGWTLCSQASETAAAHPVCPTTVQSAARTSWRLQPGSDSACSSPVLWLCWQRFRHSLSLWTTQNTYVSNIQWRYINTSALIRRVD